MTITINDLYIDLRRRFRAAGISMAELEARELTAFAAGADKRMTADWAYRYLDPDTADRAYEMAERRVEGEPLAYILGEWDFCGHTFLVNKHVLIPRPDTEPLCALAIEDAKTLDSPKVLDLCCGSGCIGLSLLCAVPDARCCAVDLSEDALVVARENARRLALPRAILPRPAMRSACRRASRRLRPHAVQPAVRHSRRDGGARPERRRV